MLKNITILNEMSAERELLRKIMDSGLLNMDLSIEVEKLLDQPEPEPVVRVHSIHADGETLPVYILGEVLSNEPNIWDLPIKYDDLLYLKRITHEN